MTSPVNSMVLSPSIALVLASPKHVGRCAEVCSEVLHSQLTVNCSIPPSVRLS